MSEFLYHYHPVEPATWFYLSSLLTIGLFFKFGRVWSVRNLDLLLLILLAPGLLFVHYGRQMDVLAAGQGAGSLGGRSLTEALPPGDAESSDVEPSLLPQNAETGDAARSAVPLAQANGTPQNAPSADAQISGPRAAEIAPVEDPLDSTSATDTRGKRVQLYGFYWLFAVGGLLLIRLLADPTMVRRPLLEPNLSAGGLTFIGCALFVFLMANVISRPADSEPSGNTFSGNAVASDRPTGLSVADRESGQGLAALPSPASAGPGYALLARLPSPARKALAIVAHLTIVLGMVLIGYRHFDNIVMGIGAATLYLMLPYTALMTNEMLHALPAAFLVWAVLCYRCPLASGVFLGLAGGTTYYPFFLLPLWISFYWPRGLVRFLMGATTVLVVLLFVLFSSSDVLQNFRLMFGLMPPAMANLSGVWDQSLGGWSAYYRIPVMAAFIALASSMALWPAQKNLGTLLSCSAAIMVATQFWHGYRGGTYMAWYLPLLLLTIFRPNLEDRVALTVLAEGWLPRRLGSIPSGKAA